MPRSAVTLAILLAAACSPRSPTIDQIIAANTEALGGAEALTAVESVWRQRNATTFTLRQRPGRHLVVLLNDTGGVRYAEGYDGTDAWEIIDDGPKRPVAERARVALWHTTQFPSELMPLARIRDHGHSLTLLGGDTLDGRRYHRLRLTLSDGFTREYFVNAETYLVERARDRRRHHAYDQTEQTIETVWSDFRSVDGVMIPFTTLERNVDTGERLSGGTMLQIRLNVAVPDDVFGPVGSIQPFLELVGRPRD